MSNPICPKCGSVSVETKTRFGIRHDCCGLWSWKGAPLVDAETHEARKLAHDAFDQTWLHDQMTRADAYALLAKKLNLPLKNCHIKLMSADVALRVPEIAREILKTLKEGKAK